MNMKNALKVFSSVLIVAALAVVSGCKKEEKTPSAPAPASAQVKKLVMATDATFPPYEYMKDSKIAGIDPEIVGEIAAKLGYVLEIKNMKFDDLIPAVQSRSADVAASGITMTADRRKLVNFTVPYVTASQVIIIPKDSTIKAPVELRGKRIGVQRRTMGDLYVREHIIEPERFENGNLAVEALRAGKLDAVVLDSEPARVHTLEHPDEIMILPIALTQEEYAFALNKDNTKLLKEFNDELIKMRASGRLQQIIDKYLKQK